MRGWETDRRSCTGSFAKSPCGDLALRLSGNKCLEEGLKHPNRLFIKLCRVVSIGRLWHNIEDPENLFGLASGTWLVTLARL